MYSYRKITDDLVYVGVDDRRLPLFENLFPLERGVSYNSYLLLDEKTALLDTCDHTVAHQFLENVEHALGGRTLDYLVIHHMEPEDISDAGAVIQLCHSGKKQNCSEGRRRIFFRKT